MLFRLYEVITYHLSSKSHQVLYILQGSKIVSTAIDFLFCVLLLTSLVAVGEAKEVYSAPAPQQKGGGMPVLPLQILPKRLSSEITGLRPIFLYQGIVLALHKLRKSMAGFNPKFPLFLNGLFKIRDIWRANK